MLNVIIKKIDSSKRQAAETPADSKNDDRLRDIFLIASFAKNLNAIG